MAFCERRTDYDHLDPLGLRQYNDCSDQFERRDRWHLCTPEYANFFYTYQWASRYDVDDHRDRFHGRHTGGFNPVAANFTVDSDTQITAIVPGGASTGRSA